jgi:hypothetical protein
MFPSAYSWRVKRKARGANPLHALWMTHSVFSGYPQSIDAVWLGFVFPWLFLFHTVSYALTKDRRKQGVFHFWGEPSSRKLDCAG